jgi:hypothetical protein
MFNFDDLLGVATIAAAGMFVALALQPLPDSVPTAAPVAGALVVHAAPVKVVQPATKEQS